MTDAARSLVGTSRTRVHCLRPALAFAIVLGLVFLPALPLQSQTFSVLHMFSGGTDGNAPQAGLVRDKVGNLYGTTQRGGISRTCSYTGPGCGTVFKLDAKGNETVLHRFTGTPDGEAPFASLITDKAGNLYGTTAYGGASNYGTVFEIDTSGQETILYSFGAYPDGEYPFAGLIMDASENIYGVTQEGGTGKTCWGGCGTVFELDQTGKETVLVDFAPPAEYPNSENLTMDAAGNIYGTTVGTGVGSGTVFRLGKTTLATMLYTFAGGAGGIGPKGGVARDVKGLLYGVTISGGDLNCIPGYGCGVVYELSVDLKERVLHTFAGPPDGAVPTGGLLRDNAGNLYGTTAEGGTSGLGTVFKLDKRGKMTVLHSFSNTDGTAPYSTLVQDEVGNLYGTTSAGGDFLCDSHYGCGVVFKIAP
jgi:uncharacterized repeat protein (TIGR03803 family)